MQISLLPDTWPGGKPVADDPGFNGLVVRTQQGQTLLQGAKDTGHMMTGKPLEIAQFSEWQPHNVRKKQAVFARLQGLVEAGRKIPSFEGLRVESLSDPESFDAEKQGTLDRALGGDFKDQSELN